MNVSIIKLLYHMSNKTIALFDMLIFYILTYYDEAFLCLLLS